MATGAPGAHPRRRALSRGVLSPIRAYSAPQARATPAIMRSFHPSANESAGSLQARRTGSGFRGRATPTKHHVARVRVARAFAELREPGARARAGACEESLREIGVAVSRRRENSRSARDSSSLRERNSRFSLPARSPRTASFHSSSFSPPPSLGRLTLARSPSSLHPYHAVSLQPRLVFSNALHANGRLHRRRIIL